MGTVFTEILWGWGQSSWGWDGDGDSPRGDGVGMGEGWGGGQSLWEWGGDGDSPRGDDVEMGTNLKVVLMQLSTLYIMKCTNYITFYPRLSPMCSCSLLDCISKTP